LLNQQPDFILVVFFPDVGHLWAGIAGDHYSKNPLQNENNAAHYAIFN